MRTKAKLYFTILLCMFLCFWCTLLNLGLYLNSSRGYRGKISIVFPVMVKTWFCYWTKFGSAHLLTVKPIYWHEVMLKESAAFCRHQKRSPGSWCSKDPKVFRDSFLKTGWGRGLSGCVISSWTFFWQGDSEVIGNQHHQPSGSSRSGVCMLVGHPEGVLVSAKQPRGHGSEYYLYRPWGGTKGPWLFLMAKVLLFCFAILSCLTAFFCFCICSLLWWNLFFGTQGRSRRLKFPTGRRQMEDMADMSSEGPMVSCSVTVSMKYVKTIH